MEPNVKIIENPNWINGTRLKLQAVKAVKEQLGLSLKEARDVIEGKEFHIHESEFKKLKTALKACGYILDTVVNDSVAPVKIIDGRGMDDEEKYKKALEKAKALHGSSEPMSGCSVILETIFPELKENEDEKIRKEIIEQINLLKSATLSDLRDKQFNSWIAWLEKQGERKYTQKDVDNAYLKGVSTSKRMFKKQQKSSWNKEDDLYVEDIISLLDFGGSTHTKEQVQNWLKSLNGRVQPQNAWLPSNEQMEALKAMAEAKQRIVEPLYSELKKLKEGKV